MVQDPSTLVSISEEALRLSFWDVWLLGHCLDRIDRWLAVLECDRDANEARTASLLIADNICLPNSAYEYEMLAVPAIVFSIENLAAMSSGRRAMNLFGRGVECRVE